MYNFTLNFSICSLLDFRFSFLTVVAHGQVISKDTTKMGYVLVDNDEVVNDTINWKKLLYQRKS
jgi:hypothetical protein